MKNTAKEVTPAVLARREYYRRWREANKEKVKAYQDNYFSKMAAEFGLEEKESAEPKQVNV